MTIPFGMVQAKDYTVFVIMEGFDDFWISLVNKPNARLLKKLFKFQRINRGSSQKGLKFTTFASRMSGEYTTSVENTLANYFILKTIFPISSIIACGDDSLVFLDRKEYDILDKSSLKEMFSYFGQDTKMDRIAFELEQIDFCQCSPVCVNGTYRMVRNPKRLFGRIQYTNLHMRDELRDKYISGLALCELSMHSGVPLIQELCLKMLNLTNMVCPSKLAIDREAMVTEQKASYRIIDYNTRLSFERAFGISPIEQDEIEKSFDATYSPKVIQFLKQFENFKASEHRDQ